MNDSPRHVECTIPVLPVSDLERSIQFYTETLGFDLDWVGDEGSTICSVSRDGCPIMLSVTHKSGPRAWVWIGLRDDTLFETYRSRGVKMRQEPENHSWAYECKFEDVDGNVLWMGRGPRKDLPFVDE